MSEGAIAPGTVLAGKFRVVSLLGEGGMGAVYEIEHELTKHRRALKLLHKAMADQPSVVERFLREASAAGRVGNPHIIETFDAGVLDTGEPYLVMEILRGEPLAARIAHGKMPILDVVDLVGQAAAGVQAAHAAGIIHRDLKPDNLFITEGADGRPFVKILDFGISKFDPTKTNGLQLTQEGAALGTPYYMPPEQIRGEGNLDARADVYALGVILYECLAGVRPFEAETLAHLAILIHTGAPVPIAELRPDLPPGFATLVQAAMATDRGQRTQTAAELRAALERYGQIGFSTQLRNLTPRPSMAPARSIAPGAVGSLATSAAGVSMRSPTPTPRKGSSSALLVVGGALGLTLATAVGGGLWWSHKRSLALEAASAAPALSAAPSSPVAVHEPASPPSTSAQSAAGPSVAPAVPDPASLRPNSMPAPPSARSAQSAVGSAAPPVKAAPRQTGRADERGLAKDNPFK
jgi:eukaryotic-like serine/threonine-protein kinase